MILVTFIFMKNKNLFNRKGLKSVISSLRKIKKSIDLINQSTTPAATSLCNTLTINVLRPPLLEKGGETLLISSNQLPRPQLKSIYSQAGMG